MNIQQLNGSGQQIWIFTMTALAALIITGSSWLLSHRLITHEAVKWYKKRVAAKEKSGRQKVERPRVWFANPYDNAGMARSQRSPTLGFEDRSL